MGVIGTYSYSRINLQNRTFLTRRFRHSAGRPLSPDSERKRENEVFKVLLIASPDEQKLR
jgi:hypothetical protein